MAATLLGALTEVFQADAALSAAQPGSPWLDEPREGLDPATAPYTVISEVHESEDWLDFEGEKSVRSVWRLTVYGAGEAATETQALALKALYNRETLAVAGRNLVKLLMTDYRARLATERSPTVRRITEVMMDFSAEWQYVG